VRNLFGAQVDGSGGASLCDLRHTSSDSCFYSSWQKCCLTIFDGILNYCRTKAALGVVEASMHQDSAAAWPRIQEPVLSAAEDPSVLIGPMLYFRE
jgi:hypothetical protein